MNSISATVAASRIRDSTNITSYVQIGKTTKYPEAAGNFGSGQNVPRVPEDLVAEGIFTEVYGE